MHKQFFQSIKNNITLGKIFRISVWIITISICLPYLLAQQYAIFKADDFSLYLDCLSMPGNSYLQKQLNFYADMYMGWQGTWSSALIFVFLNPMHFYSYRLLRIILTVIFLASIIGLFFLVHIVMDYFHLNRKNAIFLLGLFLVPLLSYRDYTEIYLWFTGITVYLLPILFFIIGFSFLLLSEMKQKKIFFFLSAIFMVLMTGGVLEFVGFGMFWLLLFIIVEYIRTKKVNKRFVIVFTLSLIGALTTAFAPGNFARKQGIGNGLEIMKAIFLSIKIPTEEIIMYSENTTFMAFVILAFLLGCYTKMKTKDSVTAFSICGLILTPIITLFPVALGYGTINSLPIRCLFILDASIIACSIGISFLLGNKLFTKNLLPDIRNIQYVACMSVLLVITLGGNKLINYTPIAITANLKNGSIQKYESDWRNIFDQIEHADEKNITIVGVPTQVAGCISPGMIDDPKWWTNQYIATYFGKESVCIVEAEE